MRIGIDVRALTLKKAGIGTYVYEIIKQLNNLDNKNEYYLYSNKKIFIDFKLNNNFKICEYPYKIGTYFIMHKLYKILKKDKIDIFFGTEHCLPIKKGKIKYLLTIHDIALIKMPKVGEFKNVIIQNLIVKKACKRADKIITISKSTKKDLIELMHIKEKRINVIYPAYEKTNQYNLTKKIEKEIEDKYRLEKNKFLFFLSTIEPRKNVDTLIRAFNKLKGKDYDLKLVISGGLGWKYKKTLRLIETSKYKDDIILTGYISNEEKNYFFENACCFVYPSLYEGFGLPIIEALSLKQIVITTNISSLPEAGGKAAFYYDNPTDFKKLAILIEKVLNLSSYEREKTINIGFEHAHKFTWEKCGIEILNEINKL